MQRQTTDGIIISCDFCGTDWDPHDTTCARPMVEGHHGSVICLTCLQQALADHAEPAGPYTCTMCLREGLEKSRWFHPAPVPGDGLNDGATVCLSCIKQAARRFHKDPDVKFELDED